ncbi:MAG: V-type ATP synthase subunit I [Paludibacteraceae bacterium]|nr:V-type ATP synthase subunit I [Paludibacteraceae bacterium]
MISKMKKYTFLVFHRDYDTFLTQLRDLGVVHITEKAAGLIENDETLQAALQHEDELRHLLAQGATDQLIQERTAIEERITAAQESAKQVAVWGDFDAQRIDALKQAGYTLRFFSCSANVYQEEWGLKVSEKEGKTYFVLVDSPALQDADNSELHEKATEIPQPEKSEAQWLQEVEHLHGLLAAANARIEAWQIAHIEEIKQQLADARQQIDWQRVQLSTDKLADGALCLIEGFCPKEKEPALNEMLESAQVYFEAEEPAKEDNTPIELKNNFYTRLFEPITRLYSLPNYTELDPTPFFAPFFMLFFGLCLGDGGYGLVILLAGLAVIFKAPKLKEWGWLGVFMGLTTMVVGILTGMFFGINLEEVAVLAPVKQYFITETNATVHFMGGAYHPMMVFAILIGIFQILFAMGFKVVKITLRDGFKYAAYDCAWLVALVTLIVWFALSGSLSPIGLYTIYGILGLCALFILFYSNPDRKVLLLNIGGGLWGTYNMVSGLLGDVLSYIRLFALGLAGGILGNVFNALALQAGGACPNWIGWLPTLLILVFGHSLNFALCLISSVVHPMRLTFVEFYKNAGFEGGGKEYKPFAKH